MVTIAASCWLRSAVAVRSANSRSSSPRIAAATSRMRIAGVAAAAASRITATRAVGSFCLTKLIVLRELLEPRSRSAGRNFAEFFGLDRVVGSQLPQVLSSIGNDGRNRRLMVGREIPAPRSADSRAPRFRRGGFPAATALIWFSTSTVCSTRPLSSRALLTRRTEDALIATSTKNPAASSRIWPIARRRAASGVTAVSHHESS